MSVLNLEPIGKVTLAKFEKLCKANPDLRLELTATGELVVMPPAGGETGSYNAELNADLVLWNRVSGKGRVFDSSTGFVLPNGAVRSPDAAWVSMERWNSLTPEERKKFLPLCPDFVLELLSPSDDWQSGLTKMQEYMDNGCRLGWLIDPESQRVAIYRSNKAPEILTAPAALSGEDVLENFTLSLSFLWQL
ncbi:MAG: Uma2 family endonuclease [Pseudanabaenaceae cyanobacterium SKYGB_i_bin29]|nr:Uma2 family endonuclease [Pseudanabaenaceae cyanobacterium SKYG29]MDW8420878.1 Uma2 family endonuclease [Pseudanabaenaceae cyanobacterium SKYGB_i_bin29]